MKSYSIMEKNTWKIAELVKFTKMLHSTQLNYLILPYWVVIILIFIDICKFQNLCDFLTSLVSDDSFSIF